MDSNSSSNSCSSSNHKANFMVGISPQYWAYTRMSVMDVLNLELRDGINWLEPQQQIQQDLSSNNNKMELLSTPVSKCLLVGHIVYAVERKGGSKAYILDDGTGVIDCVHWGGGDPTDVRDDPYHLPSLAADPREEAAHHRGFEVGEPVRVFGKIDCLASITTNNNNDDDDDDDDDNDDGDNKVVVVREIQVRIIERVEDYLVSEAHHWVDSSYGYGTGVSGRGRRAQVLSLRTHLENLGPAIREQIRNRTNLPAADDAYNAWRVFGTNCDCEQLLLPSTIREDLLYCHCQCTAEPLDPHYRFRDALLQTLLSLQSKKTTTATMTTTKQQLEFQYKEIRNNDHLQTVAWNEIIIVAENNRNTATATTGMEKQQQQKHKSLMVDKLFLKTVRALRNDGILYLLDSNTDRYLLITRKEVLEPIVQSRIGNRNNNINNNNFVRYDRDMPRYIWKVHNERLRYIQRLMMEEQTKPNEKHQNNSNIS